MSYAFVNLHACLTFSLFVFQNGLLGIFQKLLASKTHDHEGFYILNSIIEFMPQLVISVF